jgi:hypothetical protein
MITFLQRPALPFLVCMICINAFPVFGKDLDVADYYNQYINKFKTGSQFVVPYEIILSGGKWVFKNPPKHWNKVMITIDVKNGYLDAMYDDDPPGAQGRNIRVTCAVFTKTDKSVFFAINTKKTQMLPEPDLKIYSLNDGGWRDVTKQVVPKISYRMFLDEKYSQGKLSALKENESTAGTIIDYVLPRFGTTVNAVIIADYIDDIFIREGRGGGQKELKNENAIASALDDIRRNLKYGKIELKWNTRTGKFGIGNKAPNR